MEQKLYVTKKLMEDLTKLAYGMLNEKGHEVFNPTPKVLHTGVNRPPTLQEQIQRVLRINLSEQAEAQGAETFEESNDFDVVDEFDSIDNAPDSQYTIMEDEPHAPEGASEAVPEGAAEGKTENEPETSTEPVQDVHSGGTQEISPNDG